MIKQLKFLPIILILQIILINNLYSKNSFLKKATQITSKATKKSFNYIKKKAQPEKKEYTKRSLYIINDLFNFPEKEINQYIDEIEKILQEKNIIYDQKTLQKIKNIYIKLIDLKKEINELPELLNNLNNN